MPHNPEDVLVALFKIFLRASMVRTWYRNAEITPGLSFRDIQILFAISEIDSVTQAELCKVYGTPPSTMNDIVEKLIRRGLVAKKNNPDDKRQHDLSLTEKGKSELPDILAQEVGLIMPNCFARFQAGDDDPVSGLIAQADASTKKGLQKLFGRQYRNLI